MKLVPVDMVDQEGDPAGRSAVRLARLLWEQEVLSSNLSAPTNISKACTVCYCTGFFVSTSFRNAAATELSQYFDCIQGKQAARYPNP